MRLGTYEVIHPELQGGEYQMVEAAFDLVVLDLSAHLSLSLSQPRFLDVEGGGGVPGTPKGGGGNDPGAPGCCSNGFACPSAAYEDVIESITDCAFSCPISVHHQSVSQPSRLYV